PGRRPDELRLVPGVLAGRSRLVETKCRAGAHRWWAGRGGGTNPGRRARRRGALEARIGGMRLRPDCGSSANPGAGAELFAGVRRRDSPWHERGPRWTGDRRDQPWSGGPAWNVLADRSKLSLRGAGNAVTAAFIGALGAYLSNHAIFIAAAVLCIPALIALNEIRPKEIDYIRARNATQRDHTLDLQRLIDFMKNWRLVFFAGALVLFHLCNASLLPLVSENLAHSKVANSTLFMAGLIVVPQLVVAILAPWIGYWSELWGRKPLLLVAFAIEAGRALLFAFVSDPVLMLVVQVLDRVTGAAVTVLTILVTTDLTTGTGRFNLAQGVLGTIRGIAAAIGTGSVGFTVQHFGDFTGFLLMAIGPAAAALIWAFLRETKPEKYID